MRQWELDFEEAHGGLVPTHEDKKNDSHYTQLKQSAKSLEGSRKTLKRLHHTTPSGLVAAASPAPLVSAATSPAPLVRTNTTRGLRAFPSSVLDRKGSFTRHSKPAFAEEAAYEFESGHIMLSPFHIALLLIACAVPYSAFIMGFSLMGFGAMVFDYLVSNGRYFYPVSFAASGLLVAMYLFDISYWEHPLAVVARRFLLGFAGSAVLLGACLASREYPYGPLLMLFFLAPCVPHPAQASARHSAPCVLSAPFVAAPVP